MQRADSQISSSEYGMTMLRTMKHEKNTRTQHWLHSALRGTTWNVKKKQDKENKSVKNLHSSLWGPRWMMVNPNQSKRRREKKTQKTRNSKQKNDAHHLHMTIYIEFDIKKKGFIFYRLVSAHMLIPCLGCISAVRSMLQGRSRLQRDGFFFFLSRSIALRPCSVLFILYCSLAST